MSIRSEAKSLWNSARNNLGAVILTGTIGIAALGASRLARGEPNPEYYGTYSIGEETVRFHESYFSRDNILDVTLPNGDKIRYIDSRKDDFLPECVEITVGENTTEYCENSPNSKSKAIVEKVRGEKKFEKYLDSITAIQTKDLGISDKK